MMTCPPCHGRCRQGRTCPARLTTGNGGNVITGGESLPPREETAIEPSWVTARRIVINGLVAAGFVGACAVIGGCLSVFAR